jgi:hypothetical protein
VAQARDSTEVLDVDIGMVPVRIRFVSVATDVFSPLPRNAKDFTAAEQKMDRLGTT